MKSFKKLKNEFEKRRLTAFSVLMEEAETELVSLLERMMKATHEMDDPVYLYCYLKEQIADSLYDLQD